MNKLYGIELPDPFYTSIFNYKQCQNYSAVSIVGYSFHVWIPVKESGLLCSWAKAHAHFVGVDTIRSEL